MSLGRTYAVMCDVCGTWAEMAPTAREARWYALRSGFVRIPGRQYGGPLNGGRDLCREDAPASPVPTQETKP